VQNKTLISTREFIELTGWSERDFFRNRYEYGDAFPHPVTRTGSGNQYAPADVLKFVSLIIDARIEHLTAELEQTTQRLTAEIDKWQNIAGNIGERAAIEGVNLCD